MTNNLQAAIAALGTLTGTEKVIFDQQRRETAAQVIEIIRQHQTEVEALRAAVRDLAFAGKNIESVTRPTPHNGTYDGIWIDFQMALVKHAATIAAAKEG